MQPSQLNPNEDREQDNPDLSKVIERNIRTIIHLRAKAAKQRSVQDRIADAIQDKLGIVDHANSVGNGNQA